MQCTKHWQWYENISGYKCIKEKLFGRYFMDSYADCIKQMLIVFFAVVKKKNLLEFKISRFHKSLTL